METWQYKYRELKCKCLDIAHCIRVFSCVCAVVAIVVWLCYIMGRPTYVYPNQMYYHREVHNYMELEDANGDAIYINEKGIILKDADGDTIYIGGK